MLKDQNIICISSIDWDFVWQGHQEIMATFAREGNRVLFIENTGVRNPRLADASRLKKRITNWLGSVKGFRRERENLFVYSPLVLPFPYSRFARWLNRRFLLDPLARWMKATDFRDVIVWTFLPTGTALDIINAVEPKLVVYYAIADFYALTDRPKELRKTEEEVVKRCDLIFAQGTVIEERCKRLNPNVTIFPFGVNTDVFEEYLQKPAKPVPAEVKALRRPVIGYIGGVHKHVDLALLKEMAHRHRDWSFVMVGPVQTDVAALESVPNITFVGQKTFAELPSYVDQFDVCMIPYVVSEYTKTVYPTKLNEYHIMGKPVVSTFLPEVEAFNRSNGNIVAMAHSHDEFMSLVEKALSPAVKDAGAGRIRSARKNSWSERVKAMSLLMERALEEKAELPAPGWQERFLALYRHTRKGIYVTAAALLAAWLLIFYTPLVWTLARPLVVADTPAPADAIVVFAGGVGESGKAGQGYEERVAYAVELYKKGYAPHLIFSSGYSHFFKETLLMKALAVSLGVPESAIVLEGEAKNTYQNVAHTKEIADREGWDRLLVVSSPYHMARVRLVMNKMGEEDARLLPLLKSSFYAHERASVLRPAVSWRQIKALAHEYLGILYYWWKGWI